MTPDRGVRSKLWEGPSRLFNSQVICSPLTVCVLMTSLLFVVISGNSMTYLPGSRAKWTRQASLKIMIIDSRGEIGIVLKFTSTDPHLITLLRGSPYQKRDKNTQQITLALYISKHNTLWKARSFLAKRYWARLWNADRITLREHPVLNLREFAKNNAHADAFGWKIMAFFAARMRSERPDGDWTYCRVRAASPGKRKFMQMSLSRSSRVVHSKVCLPLTNWNAHLIVVFWCIPRQTLCFPKENMDRNSQLVCEKKTKQN